MFLENSKITHGELLANGWMHDLDQRALFPCEKVLQESMYCEPELAIAITTLNNKFELCIHHYLTGALIYLRSPESLEELAKIEQMIIGCEEL